MLSILADFFLSVEIHILKLKMEIISSINV